MHGWHVVLATQEHTCVTCRGLRACCNTWDRQEKRCVQLERELERERNQVVALKADLTEAQRRAEDLSVELRRQQQERQQQQGGQQGPGPSSMHEVALVPSDEVKHQLEEFTIQKCGPPVNAPALSTTCSSRAIYSTIHRQPLCLCLSLLSLSATTTPHVAPPPLPCWDCFSSSQSPPPTPS